VTEPLLEVRDVHVRFQGRKGTVARAVDGVDLEVRPGEVLALVGESGCGKTPLARAILGLERPVEGEVRFRGAPLAYDNAALRRYRRAVQMVFQDPTGSLNPRQTIYEAVAEGLRIQKVGGDEVVRVADALSRAGLRPPERFMPLYPYEVSILVVTHDLGLAWNIADRIAVMYLGRIVEQGTTEELLDDPRHPYTRALLSVVPEVEQMRPEILQGEAPDPTRIPPGCRFHPRCPLVASGETARLGIEARCTGEDPSLRAVGDAAELSVHAAACHAVGEARTTG